MVDKQRTPGEELYLVHLQRLREEDDDHDYLPRKRRSSSVGEELWKVHRRRSLGMEDDSDRDIVLDNRDYPKHDVSSPKKKADTAKYRYNLRSRDSQIKKA
jgi:hypothetical protein